MKILRAGFDRTERQRKMAEKKLVALTFDDGPSVGTTDKVLDVLKENDIVASFFLIGQKITEESAYLVKRAYDMGCTMENHSKTHPGMTGLSDEEILEEISYTTNKIEEITGEKPAFSVRLISTVTRDCSVWWIWALSAATAVRTGCRRSAPKKEPAVF